MSRQSTVTLLDDIGYEHDELVIQWRNFLFSRINVQAAQVSYFVMCMCKNTTISFFAVCKNTLDTADLRR
jgi:hypothetical protein